MPTPTFAQYAGFAVLVSLASPLPAKIIAVAAGPDAQERLQTALIEAEPGDVVSIGEGRFDLTDGLSLDVAGVVVRGTGPDRTILSFKNQKSAGEGLLVTADDVVLRDLAVEDTKGDGIKSKGADRIVYHNVRVEWTRGPNPANGAYGVYPVESTDVLVDGVTVIAASDAGIYVGQSKNIVVRNSVAQFNVAGIEIENSYNADVHDNVATRNTAGILAFDLPNLPMTGGHSVRIFNNVINRNDTPNFAPKGNIVANVPMGLGVMVMAHRNVHVFENAFDENATANVMIVGYRYPQSDANYNPLPLQVTVRDNAHGKAGWEPGFPGGKELAAAMGGTLPPVIWDGSGQDIRVTDAVGVLSLGLPDIARPLSAARPFPVMLDDVAAMPEPQPVVLPSSMEAALK